MIDLGTVRPGSTIRIPFSSFDKDDGSSITMTNYAAADILAYKDGSTTERASTAGFTATTDFDGKTGKHLAVIDLADNTTAGFWAAGSEYLIAIDAVTVDAVTTGGWIARFKIGYPDAAYSTTIATLSSQTSFTLSDGPAEDDAINGAVVLIHDVASAVQHGYAVVSDYTGSTKTVTLTAGVTFTAAATDNISIFPPGNARWFAALLGVALPLTPTTAGRTLDVSAGGEAGVDWANVGSPTTTVGLSGTTVKTATDVETDTADIQSRIPAALVGGRMDSNMGAVSGDATAADNLETLLDDTAGQVPWAGIVDQGTAQSATGTTLVLRSAAAFADDELIGATIVITGGTGIGQSRTITDYVSSTDTATVDAWTTTPSGTITYKIFATAPSSGGSGPSAATIADAVWDELLSGHAVSGSAGEALSAAGTAGDPWTTALPGAYGSGTAGKIIGDNINATISSRASQASVDTVDGIVDSILVDTAEIGAAGAGLTALATAANLATVAGYLDTEIAAILADTNELQTDWTNGGRLDLILDARASQASVDTIDGIVDSILVDTAEIGAAGAGLTVLATQASVNTIDDLLDTEMPALTTAVADLPTNAELATALAAADDAVLAAVATVDTVVDAIKAKTDSLTFTTAGMVDSAIKRVGDTTLNAAGTGGQGYGA